MAVFYSKKVVIKFFHIPYIFLEKEFTFGENKLILIGELDLSLLIELIISMFLMPSSKIK